jgi:arylsulfatase A-like enzyme
MRCLISILAVCLWILPAKSALAMEQPQKKPNIVMIVVDDMRFDEFGAGGHPFLETPQIDQLANEGVNFTRAYHASPLCSPNRASLLTGQYPSRHGVVDNTSRSNLSHRLELFPRLLQSAGYRTAHIGKWHMGNDPTPRPGYDYWVSYAGQGKLVNPELYEEGKTSEVKGYITDILTEKAVQFINDSAQQPFFLYVGHKAVHPEASQRNDGSADLSVQRKYIAAKRHEGRYKSAEVPTLGQYPVKNDLSPLNESLSIRKALEQSDDRWDIWINSGFSKDAVRKRAEMMLAVDDSLGQIIQTLKEQALLDNTLIIFTSDNGYFYGEHGLTIERRYPYEEAIKAPLIIKQPKTQNNLGSADLADILVSSIDLAPTILAYADVEIPTFIQGRSLYSALEGGDKHTRDAVLIEYFAHENPFIWTAKIDYKAIIVGPYKLVKWNLYDNEYELYNLQDDPRELNNLAKQQAYKTKFTSMLGILKTETLNALGMN